MKRKLQDLASLDLYQNREKVKWAIFIFSFVIGLGSIYYTNTLVEELKIREKRQVDLYAEALEYASVNSDNLTFVFQVIIQENKSIPVITVNTDGEPIEYKNINLPANSSEEEIRLYLLEELESMKALYEPISLSDDVFIYYRNSDLLTRLQYYPYVQLSVILVFGLLASLMAWIDYLKNSPVYDENQEVILEIEKDINKLTMVTERFSNIGSTPVIKPENVYQIVGDAINYLRPRISNKVSIELNSHAENIYAQMNRSLFEWVIENVCKNAVDAMKGQGAIRINIVKESEQFVFVDISDTGKGIEKKMFAKVFNPGFTTRKRGWGLGLTLAKRIMEGYHNGRIFVNTSELGKGTTFRIVLHGVTEQDEID